MSSRGDRLDRWATAMTGLSAAARRRAAPLLVLAAAALLFAPTVRWLVTTWLAHPYYSHGLVVPLVCAWLVWRSRHEIASSEPGDLGLTLVAVGVLVHVVSLPRANFPLSAVGLVIVAAGVAALAGGRHAVRVCMLPLVLLIAAIPVPIVENLAPPMAAGVAHAAADAATSLGVSVQRSGAQLTVAQGSFVVGAPCSGLRSLVALVTLAVLAAGVSSASVPRRLVLPIVAIALAIVGNWVRMTSLIVAVDRLGVQRGLDTFHTLSGPVVFVVTVVGLLVVGHQLGQGGARRD